MGIVIVDVTLRNGDVFPGVVICSGLYDTDAAPFEWSEVKEIERVDVTISV